MSQKIKGKLEFGSGKFSKRRFYNVFFLFFFRNYLSSLKQKNKWESLRVFPSDGFPRGRLPPIRFRFPSNTKNLAVLAFEKRFDC